MYAIIIYQEKQNNGVMITGGIYKDITEKAAAACIEKENNTLMFYIPLVVSGKTYQDKKTDLENKAKEYQNTCFDFCGFSYGELAIIESFFERNGKRYGLLTEFRENCII